MHGSAPYRRLDVAPGNATKLHDEVKRRLRAPQWLCRNRDGRRLLPHTNWSHFGNGIVRSNRAMPTAMSGLTTGQAAYLLPC
ncbi:hypothetical protein DVDV_2942 [Desulfovibrio sp. DV]|nr:hypothetical protein DVDV_2942 [Desulfovibrio sp. DV]